jgi:hypothetical protein
MECPPSQSESSKLTDELVLSWVPITGQLLITPDKYRILAEKAGLLIKHTAEFTEYFERCFDDL